MNRFRLKKNIYISVFSFLVNLSLTFICYKLLIIYDGIESLGLWSVLLAWSSLVRVADAGMGSSVLNYVSNINLDNDKRCAQEYIDTALILNTFTFFGLAILWYVAMSSFLMHIVESKHLIVANELLPIIFTTLFLSALQGTLISGLQAIHHGYIGSYLVVIGNVMQIIFVLLLIKSHGLVGLAYAQLFQMVIVNIALFLFLRHFLAVNFTAKLKYSMVAVKRLFSYSIKMQIANVLNSIFEPVSKILCGQFGSLENLGFYELAYKTVSLTRNVLITGLYSSLPKFIYLIKNHPQDSIAFYKKSYETILKSTVIQSIVVVIISPLISILWLGEIYSNFILYIFFISIGYFINSYGACAYNIGLATGVLKYNIATSAIILIVLVIFSCLLGYFYNTTGVVLSATLSLAIGGIIIKKHNENLLGLYK